MAKLIDDFGRRILKDYWHILKDWYASKKMYWEMLNVPIREGVGELEVVPQPESTKRRLSVCGHKHSKNLVHQFSILASLHVLDSFTAEKLLKNR